MIDPTTPPAKRSFSMDLKTLLLILIAVALGFLVFDRLHRSDTVAGEERTISVTGEATLHETPDEFVFYPSYQFKNADKNAALAELTKKSDEVVAELKKLGVADDKIKTSTSGGSYGPIYYDDTTSKDVAYTLQLTITATSNSQAQKVQDYLAGTGPTGQVSPQPNFSDAKRKSLEAKARDQATQEARSKADQSAKNLGFKVDKVKSVDDGTGFGGGTVLRNDAQAVAPMAAGSASPALTVQPGLNDIRYTVTVVYTIK